MDLINVGKTASFRRRGKPSANENVCITPTSSKINREDSVRPSDNVRTDTVDHLADFDNKKIATRCKLKEC